MKHFNGKAQLLCHDPKSIGILQCDSSLKGLGVYFNGDFIAGSWSNSDCPLPLQGTKNWYPVEAVEEEKHDINYLELCALC